MFIQREKDLKISSVQDLCFTKIDIEPILKLFLNSFFNMQSRKWKHNDLLIRVGESRSLDCGFDFHSLHCVCLLTAKKTPP